MIIAAFIPFVATDSYRNQELMASGHSLSDSALSAFSEMLRINTGLRRLGLGDDNLGDRGIVLLAPGLAANRGIQELELDFKSISTEGAASLSTICMK